MGLVIKLKMGDLFFFTPEQTLTILGNILKYIIICLL